MKSWLPATQSVCYQRGDPVAATPSLKLLMIGRNCCNLHERFLWRNLSCSQSNWKRHLRQYRQKSQKSTWSNQMIRFTTHRWQHFSRWCVRRNWQPMNLFTWSRNLLMIITIWRLYLTLKSSKIKLKIIILLVAKVSANSSVLNLSSLYPFKSGLKKLKPSIKFASIISSSPSVNGNLWKSGWK